MRTLAIAIILLLTGCATTQMPAGSSVTYEIEGLNREPVNTPAPRYDGDRDLIMRVRIEVGPRGNVISAIPVQRTEDSFDRRAILTVRQWRFNALPSNAPQVNQSGVVELRFKTGQ